MSYNTYILIILYHIWHFSRIKSTISGYTHYMSFAENVKSEIEYQDIQIKELAFKTGISRNTLTKYLSGKESQPGVENAVKIAQALGVTVEYLVTGKTLDEMQTFQARNVLRQYLSLSDFNRRTIEDLLHSLVSRQIPQNN